MTTLDTIYFPDTILRAQHQFALSLFFSTIHILHPVETEESKEGDSKSFAEGRSFMDRGFCQTHTPSPLRADRDRFLHLLHDIQNRKDHFVEQLQYLSLASLSTTERQHEGSKQTIISSLLHGVDQKTGDQDEQNRQALWQARLVLKIAEFLDQEEDDLAQQLAAIDDREIALFRDLQGEITEAGEGDKIGEDPFTEILALRQKMNQPRPGTINQRLRAWNRLYLSEPAPKIIPLWTASRPEVADMLVEHYEKECALSPIHLLHLELPSHSTGAEEERAEKIPAFIKATQSCQQALADIFHALVQDTTPTTPLPAQLLSTMESWGNDWNTAVNDFFPAHDYGRAGLSFSLLPTMPLDSLLRQMSGRKITAPLTLGLLAVYESPVR